jgi:hypothetical protein
LDPDILSLTLSHQNQLTLLLLVPLEKASALSLVIAANTRRGKDVHDESFAFTERRK